MRRVSEDASRRLAGITTVRVRRILGQPEIKQDDVVLVRELQILRLDVTVDDRRLVRVQVSKRVEKLIRPEHHPAYGERLIRGLKPRRKVVARDVFHHEILISAVNKVVADLRKDRMPQTGKDPCFPLKSSCKSGIACVTRPLQRDGTAQSLIDGEIDLAHSAFTDQMNDQVAILDHCIWGQRIHFVFGRQIAGRFLK